MRKVIIFFVIFNNFFVFSCNNVKENILLEILKEKSYFHEFEVINEKVLIRCNIFIKNNTKNNVSFKINAIFKDDVRTGLIKQEILEGYNEDLETNIFTISANEIVNFTVIFLGEFAGQYQKHNRELPKKINIDILK